MRSLVDVGQEITCGRLCIREGQGLMLRMYMYFQKFRDDPVDFLNIKQPDRSQIVLMYTSAGLQLAAPTPINISKVGYRKRAMSLSVRIILLRGCTSLAWQLPRVQPRATSDSSDGWMVWVAWGVYYCRWIRQEYSSRLYLTRTSDPTPVYFALATIKS